MTAPAERRVSLGLRVGLVTVVLLTVVITTLIVYVPFFYISRDNIREMVGQINEQIMVGTTSEVGRFFTNALSAQTTVRDLLARDVVGIKDAQRRADLFATFLLSSPSYSWVSFGWPNGDFFGVQRSGHDTYQVVMSRWDERHQRALRTTQTYSMAEGQARLEATETKEHPYYAPKRAWYQKAVATKATCWTDVYVFDTSRKPGINSAAPLFKDGQLVGVSSVAIELDQISRYLKTIQVAKTGTVFIVNSRDQLVAFPDAAELTRPSAGSELPELRRLGESQNPLLKIVDQAFRANQVSPKAVRALQQLVYRDPTRNQTYFVTVAPVTDIDWIVGTVIPESDFLDTIEHKTKAVLYVVLVFVTIAGALGYHITRVLVRKTEEAFAETEEARREAEAQRQVAVEKGKQLEVRNRFIRATFGRYLSEEIVSSLLESPEGLKLGGEKRKVTIMMTDLRGFTSLSERLAPEQVVRMINIYLEAMTEIIVKYEGTIDEFIGDAILVIFGAPVLKPDDAERAVACAVEMQLAMGRVNERLVSEGLPEVEMGIGLNTGEVVVGNIGSTKRAKYGVVGSNVNLTSRVESYTVGGQILVPETTRNEVADILRTGAEMTVEPKGVKKPITIYEVLGIGGRYDLSVSRAGSALVCLPSEIPVRFVVLQGKDSAGEATVGQLVRLGKREAEVRSEQVVEPLANLKIQLLTSSGATASEVYAKVLPRKVDGDRGFAVRFTSVPPEARAFLDTRLLADGKLSATIAFPSAS